MGTLDIKVYNNKSYSIKDCSHDIDISETKWDSIFNFLTSQTNYIYFYGKRINFEDDEYDKIVDYLAEEIYISEERFKRLMIKINLSNILISRNLLSKIWFYFEFPSIIFLLDGSQENELLNCLKSNIDFMAIAQKIEEICILYQNFEPDVIWIHHGSKE